MMTMVVMMTTVLKVAVMSAVEALPLILSLRVDYLMRRKRRMAVMK